MHLNAVLKADSITFWDLDYRTLLYVALYSLVHWLAQVAQFNGVAIMCLLYIYII